MQHRTEPTDGDGRPTLKYVLVLLFTMVAYALYPEKWCQYIFVSNFAKC